MSGALSGDSVLRTDSNKNDVMFYINLLSISQERGNKIICSKYLLSFPFQQLFLLLIFHSTILLHSQAMSCRDGWPHYYSQLQGRACDQDEPISTAIGSGGHLTQSITIVFNLRIAEPEEDKFLSAVLAPNRISRYCNSVISEGYHIEKACLKMKPSTVEIRV